MLPPETHKNDDQDDEQQDRSTPRVDETHHTNKQEYPDNNNENLEQPAEDLPNLL
jgi:hypothetical protein